VDAEKDHNDHALVFVAVACSGRYLVEEYLACRIWPLGRRWFVGPVIRRDFVGFERKI
jgi:hypothetical protein